MKSYWEVMEWIGGTWQSQNKYNDWEIQGTPLEQQKFIKSRYPNGIVIYRVKP